MSLWRQPGARVVVATLMVAFLLDHLPLPEWLARINPDWLALVLIYWCLALPHRVGIGVAWVSGLFLDVQQGTVFGQHALALTIIAYIIITQHQRIRVFPLAQQALLICVLLLLSQLLTLWIRSLMGFSPQHWTYWAPAFTSMLIWPWLFIILRDIRRKFYVH